MRPHDWRPRRSLYYINKQLEGMLDRRIRMLEHRLRPIPPAVYADQAVALMKEAIEQDPLPEPTDWAALALDSEPRLEQR